MDVPLKKYPTLGCCGLDCGFPMCMFENEDLGVILKSCSKSKFGCGPALDIGPELNVWPCFPFSKHIVGKLNDFEKFEDLREACKHKINCLSKSKYLHKKCRDCRYRLREQCAGGCKAHVVKMIA